MVATVTIKTYSAGSLGVPFSQKHYFVYFVAIRQCYCSTFTYWTRFDLCLWLGVTIDSLPCLATGISQACRISRSCFCCQAAYQVVSPCRPRPWCPRTRACFSPSKALYRWCRIARCYFFNLCSRSCLVASIVNFSLALKDFSWCFKSNLLGSKLVLENRLCCISFVLLGFEFGLSLH